MIKCTLKSKKTDLYQITDKLYLLNIITKDMNGKAERIDTYIGEPNADFIHVGSAEELNSIGSRFTYSAYMKTIEMNLRLYVELYSENKSKK